MAQDITLLGASYSDVPSVLLPKTGGGMASFTDVTDTTATAADVASGKYFFTASGVLTLGTSSGGGGSNIPTFTMTLDSSFQVTSVTCDMTFAQCVAILENDEYTANAIVVFPDSSTGVFPACGYIVSSINLWYVMFDQSNMEPIVELMYNGAGTISATIPPTYIPSLNATQNDTYEGLYNGVTVNVASPVKTATGTFTGNGTRTIDVTCAFEPDLIYVTSNPGTTASSGTVALIIARGMMAATRYRNNSTTNSHYAAIDIVDMNTSGSSYSWRATYANSKVTLYCYSNNARGLLTNGRTYTYTFMKWT